MTNAIENARKALVETELAGTSIATYHAMKAAVEALRALLESLEDWEIDIRGEAYGDGYSDGYYQGLESGYEMRSDR